VKNNQYENGGFAAEKGEKFVRLKDFFVAAGGNSYV
jgi:hypothetical protein